MLRILSYTMLVIVTSIAGASSVAAQQGTAPVKVVSPLPLPVTDADNPGRHPFQAQLCAGCSPTSITPSTLTVPSDVRLVIEFVSALCEIQGSASLYDAAVTTIVGGNTVPHSFAPTPTFVTATDKRSVITHTTRLYADPGTQVGVFIRLSAGTANVSFCSFSISGYTIAP